MGVGYFLVVVFSAFSTLEYGAVPMPDLHHCIAARQDARRVLADVQPVLAEFTTLTCVKAGKAA